MQIRGNLLFISMLGVFAVFSSCDDIDTVDSQVDFLFKETYCANPWDMITPQWTPEQLISYYLFDVFDVEFSDLNITYDGVQQVCDACTCLTGILVRITAEDEYSESLLGAGFEIEE